MEIISHRVNSVSSLEELDRSYGAEIDVRSSGRELVLAHDPFTSGAPLDEFLRRFADKHPESLLILNPKEDGLEDAILEKLRAYRIERFFFLDLTLPILVRMAFRKTEKRLAVRVSEYEPAEAAERFANAADWVWLDCFSGNAPEAALVRRLRRQFKVCLVSPELQGFPSERAAAFAPLAAEVDAVCTKFPALWS